MSKNKRYWLFQFCGWGLFALINIFFAECKHQLYIDERNQKCKNQRGEYEIQNLFFKSFLEKIETDNYIPHYMGNNDTHENENSYTRVKENSLILCAEFIE